MANNQKKLLFTIPLLLSLSVSTRNSLASEWLRGAFRVNTDVSAGKNNFSDIAKIATEKNIDFIVFTDQYIVRGEYGILPFRNLLKVVRDRRSIVTFGVEKYLKAIEAAQWDFADVILIPGADVAPIYEWSGSPLNPPVTGYRWSQQITVLGSNDVDFYRNIPTIHNDPLGFKFPDTLIKWIPFPLILFGFVCIRSGVIRYYDHQGRGYSTYEKPRMVLGAVISFISLMWFINNRPFSITRYSQYKKNGLAPFQNLIDYVREKDGLAFWSHPEMEMRAEYGPFGHEKYGRVVLHTLKYLEDVENTFGHNGLAGLYGDAITAYLPGNAWDRMLIQYCRGEREVCPVIVGEIDYHMDRPLDLIQTVVKVETQSVQEILQALKNGNSYAVVGGGITKHLLVADATLSVESAAAGLGETLVTDRQEAVLIISGEWKTSGANSHIPGGKLFIIVNGKMTKEIEFSESPFKITEKVGFEDQPDRQYVRFYLQMGGTLLSNPIFVTRTGS
jgi:hypothetical protein